MGRLLKLALEGEQIEVVEGMFVAVPLGASQAVQALSTESFGEAVQKATHAVWERIAKLIAGIAAAVKGVIKWLIARFKGDKGRKVNQEITHQYEVLEESIRNFGQVDPDSKMESITKADRLDEHASRSLSATAHALLDDPKAYLEAVHAVEKMMDSTGQAATVEASAKLVSFAKVGPDHPINQNDAERIRQEVSHVHAHFERLPEYLGIIHELIASAYKNKAAERLPANPTKLAAVLTMAREVLTGTATVDTFERWTKELTLIDKDMDQATKATHAHLRVIKDDDSRDRAQAMLAGYRAFWKEMQPIFKALNMLDQLRHGVFQLTNSVIDFWKAVVKRTMEEYKGQDTVLNRIVDLDKIFQSEAAKLKQLIGM